MKVVVIGGTGRIGAKVVNHLRQRGHEVVAAAPGTGVNAVTGEGLDQALAGARAVVDATDSPSFEPAAAATFFEAVTRNLLAAEGTAGVAHHVALSIVGADRLPASGYYRAKVAQENLIRASPVAHTVVRATQFFEFAEGIAATATDGQTVRLPPALVQPVAAEEVAAALAEVAAAEPRHGTLEVAGPEPMRLDDFVRRFLAARRDPRQVQADAEARYFGAALDDRSLLPGPHPILGRVTFTDWLQGLNP